MGLARLARNAGGCAPQEASSRDWTLIHVMTDPSAASVVVGSGAV
jgi:hypothetical protein